jgi:hypothetical protein
MRLVTPVLGLVIVMIFRYFDFAWQYFRLPKKEFSEYVRSGL